MSWWCKCAKRLGPSKLCVIEITNKHVSRKMFWSFLNSLKMTGTTIWADLGSSYSLVDINQQKMWSQLCCRSPLKVRSNAGLFWNNSPQYTSCSTKHQKNQIVSWYCICKPYLSIFSLNWAIWSTVWKVLRLWGKRGLPCFCSAGATECSIWSKEICRKLGEKNIRKGYLQTISITGSAQLQGGPD